MGLHGLAAFLAEEIANAQHGNPDRDQVDGDCHTRRDQHDHQHGRHKQQADPVTQRIEQGREARRHALLLFRAAELDVRR